MPACQTTPMILGKSETRLKPHEAPPLAVASSRHWTRGLSMSASMPRASLPQREHY